MPPFAYFSAKIVTSVAFSALVVAALFLLGATAGHVRLPSLTWFALGGSLLLGALPFCALGLAIGYLAGPNSAAAVVNLINLPMAFLSGLWIPIGDLPAAIQRVAPFFPAYHLGQLALGTIGASNGGAWWTHVLALLGFTVLFLGAAAFGFRRDEDRVYG
jgi:ABC-2 type transport system permease protein